MKIRRMIPVAFIFIFILVGCVNTESTISADLQDETEKTESNLLTMEYGENFFIETEDAYKVGYDSEEDIYYVFWYDKSNILIGVSNLGCHYPEIEKLDNGYWHLSVGRGTALTQHVYFDAEEGYLNEIYNVLDRIGESIVYVVDIGIGEESKSVLCVQSIFASNGYDIVIDRNINWRHGPFIQAEFLDEQSLKVSYMTDDGREMEEVVTW